MYCQSERARAARKKSPPPTRPGHALRNGQTPPCFRRRLPSGLPPPLERTRRDGLAADSARRRVGSYLQDTPGVRRLKHQADSALAPDITPEAARLPRLVHTPRPAGRVASGCYPTGPPSYVHGIRRGIVAAEVPFGPFSGEKLQAPGYPSMTVVRSSAPPPSGLTGKPYAFGPLTVELFAVGFPRSPSGVGHPVAALADPQAPRASASCPREIPPDPFGGICLRVGDAPAWRVTSFAAPNTQRRSVPVAPRPRGTPSGRTLGLVFSRGAQSPTEGLLQRAPAEPDEPLSRHPALGVVGAVAGDRSAPFLAVVSRVPGWRPPFRARRCHA